jgi:Tol biopolymer transport system component
MQMTDFLLSAAQPLSLNGATRRWSAICATLLATLIGCGRPAAHFEGFTFSPDNTYLAAAYLRGGSSFIYKIPLDTGKAVRLTKVTDGYEGIPSFSPDGRRIIYSYSPQHGGHSRIVISNVDGSSSYPWRSGSETDDLRPLFASDDKTIIFARSGYYGSYSPIAQPAQHEWNFYASDLDGDNLRQLTSDNFYLVSRASVSPDGKTLLFVSSEQNGDVILGYSLDQPPKPKVILRPGVGDTGGGTVLGDAMFMPDGNAILFDAATTGSHGYFDYDIYHMDLHTQRVEKLTAANGYSYGLQLSHDGKTAVFMRDIPHWYGSKTEIFLLDLATRKLTPFTVTGLD